MNTIQAVMLIALGFIVASLLGLGAIPAYRRRCERLAEERVRRMLPATEAEIRADRDRLRAEFAVKSHQLSTRLEAARLAAARQTIEINRRDARVTELEATSGDLAGRLEEMSNARTVLEATVQDRLPKVEQRLAEAKKLIFQRDREIAALTADAGKQARAFEEAAQLNGELKSEVARLTAHLAARTAESGAEAALKAEVESLRLKAVEQAEMVARLQASIAAAGGSEASAAADAVDEEITRLRGEAAAAQARAASAASAAEAGKSAVARLEEQVRTLKARLDDHASEAARLKAALSVFEAGERDAAGDTIRESKTGLKARVSSLEAELASQAEIATRLRAELAASNERLAQQAALHTDEMRKLGSAKPLAPSRRTGLAERLTQVRPEAAAPAPEPARLAPAPAVAAVAAIAAVASAGDVSGKGAERANGASFLKALSGESGEPAKAPAQQSAAGDVVIAAARPAAGEDASKKPRLVDRIAGLAKS